jgi:hypothetical protein
MVRLSKSLKSAEKETHTATYTSMFLFSVGRAFPLLVGNQRFRLVVQQYLGGYKQAATKQEKTETVSSIVDDIRVQTGPIGGFIKKVRPRLFYPLESQTQM